MGRGKRERYAGNKEEWMDGVHYVKQCSSLINVCTVSTMKKKYFPEHYNIRKD